MPPQERETTTIRKLTRLSVTELHARLAIAREEVDSNRDEIQRVARGDYGRTDQRLWIAYARAALYVAEYQYRALFEAAAQAHQSEAPADRADRLARLDVDRAYARNRRATDQADSLERAEFFMKVARASHRSI